MLGRESHPSWLGAEALPGDLAGIAREQQAWLDALARRRQYADEIRQRDIGAADMNWQEGPLRSR